jgi:competence protein ComEC
VLENIDVQEVTTGSPEKIRANTACNQTQRWQWDGVTFSVLWPPKGVTPADKENNRSCVVRVTVNDHAVLLTGDIEKPVERLLVDNSSEQLRSELLIAPHHGSKTSSTDPFIAAVNPSEVVFSSGYMSRFGHPHPEVVARYERRDVGWLNTADSGGLLYRLDRDGISRIEAYRRAHPRYWEAP